MRPTLFRLASDTEDNDEALGECAVGLMTEVTFSPQRHFMEPAAFHICKTYLSFFPLTADILQANDSLTHVINQYRQLVKGEDMSKDDITTPSQPSRCLCLSVSCSAGFPPCLCTLQGHGRIHSLSKSGSSGSALLDLMELNASANSSEPSGPQNLTQNTGISLLDDELMSLGKHKNPHSAGL